MDISVQERNVKRAIILLSMVTLLIVAVGSVARNKNREALAISTEQNLSSAPAQTAQSEADVPPLITENLVVFLAPTQKEYDELTLKDPDKEFMLTEWLSDYYRYSVGDVAPKLKEMGINVKFETWKEMRYRDAEGKEGTLSREDFAAIVMYPKGKPPALANPQKRLGIPSKLGEITFSPDSGSMAEVISKYFGVKID